jgi:hypothetical protein
MINAIKAWWDRQRPPKRTYTDAEKARMIRDLLQPCTYKWAKYNPGLEFDIESESNGSLAVIVRTAKVKQAAFYIDSARVLPCFDNNGCWMELERDLLNGAVAAAKEAGLVA